MVKRRWDVIVTRDITESTVVEIEAESAEAAEAAALESVMDSPCDFRWTPDDGVAGDPYIGAPSEAQEIEEAEESKP